MFSLYGISNVQIYLYCRRSSDDHWLMKVMVGDPQPVDNDLVFIIALSDLSTLVRYLRS